MSKKQFFFGIIIASVIGSALTIGALNYFDLSTKIYQTIQTTPEVRQSTYNNINTEQRTGLDFTETAELATPAVVHIKVYKQIKSGSGYSNSPFNDMMREFFGDRYQKELKNHDNPQLQQMGSGSGVLITNDGFIVTNNHVINGADEIVIVMNDKRKFTAELVGKDPTTDLALVKIDEVDLPFLEWGNSDDLKVGEWVLAVGNPFNLTSTVTAGIVSAKARNINILRDKDNMAIESFIQTDAAVNPGNSGGALVRSDGKLIGINSAIASPTGAFTGYSFAIPSNLTKKVINDLKDFGEVQRALLGVSIVDVNAELAEEKGLGELKGVYIAGVREDGSASEAKIQIGDVIVKIDGHDVNTISELQAEVGGHRPGDEITITYIRDGKKYNTKAVLRNKLGTTEIVTSDSEAIQSILGAKFQKSSDKRLTNLRLRNGVEIISLSDGKIKEAGIQKGFVVVAIDKQPVYSPSDIANILAARSGGDSGVLIEGIYPNGQRAYYGLGL